jgi:hypothetical protein
MASKVVKAEFYSFKILRDVGFLQTFRGQHIVLMFKGQAVEEQYQEKVDALSYRAVFQSWGTRTLRGKNQDIFVNAKKIE